MDIWDWIKGLRCWWWMIPLIPLLAMGIAWLALPEAEYETTWELQIELDGLTQANSPAYFDFILLDDLTELLRSDVLGDIVYRELPEDLRSDYSRDEIGSWFNVHRRSRFVEITVKGDDASAVQTVAETTNAVLPDAINEYLIPVDYQSGPAVLHQMSAIDEPQLNSSERLMSIGIVGVAFGIVAVVLTGVAEWFRMSYRAKYASR